MCLKALALKPPLKSSAWWSRVTDSHLAFPQRAIFPLMAHKEQSTGTAEAQPAREAASRGRPGKAGGGAVAGGGAGAVLGPGARGPGPSALARPQRSAGTHLRHRPAGGCAVTEATQKGERTICLFCDLGEK